MGRALGSGPGCATERARASLPTSVNWDIIVPRSPRTRQDCHGRAHSEHVVTQSCDEGSGSPQTPGVGLKLPLRGPAQPAPGPQPQVPSLPWQQHQEAFEALPLVPRSPVPDPQVTGSMTYPNNRASAACRDHRTVTTEHPYKNFLPADSGLRLQVASAPICSALLLLLWPLPVEPPETTPSYLCPP